MNLMLNNKISPVSLIPYLRSGDTGITIKLTADQEDDLQVHSRLIFQAVSENNPFSKMIPAKIISNATGLSEAALLLIQKDTYTLPDEIELLTNPETNPETNTKIEKNWQQAFMYYSTNRLSNPPLILDNQINENGELLPFQPVWYCRNQQVFFQPLCPDCGKPLDQCVDDDLLIKNDLMPFSESVQRYLYCPRCIESTAEKAVFYVPELGPRKDKDVPTCLKSLDDLIIGMGKLKGKDDLSSDFPCSACDNHQECFGEEKMAVLRIAVFSFYPFYMMIFKTSCTNAVDLFSMISQPVVTEIENQEQTIPEAVGGLKDKVSLESSVAKKAIQSILKNILQTWQKEAPASPVQNQYNSASSPKKEQSSPSPLSVRESSVPELSGQESSGEADLDRTVIISSRQDITKRMAAFAQKQDLEKTVVISKKDTNPPEDNDADNRLKRQMEKTVIITADTMEKPPSSLAGQGQESVQTMEKTVIINPKANAAEDKTEIIRNNQHDRQNRHDNDDLDKTVIISSDKTASANKYAADAKSVLGGFSSGSDRTIIFADDLDDVAHLTKDQSSPKRPSEKIVLEKTPPKKIPSDEALEKTVIINPSKQ